MPGASFDRVAEIYDETRGGERRGDQFAAALAPWIVGAKVVELGVGTGVVAAGLADYGHNVVGVDLSASMLSRAVNRVGSQVAVADVDQLPMADDSVDTAFFVWVLQLVDNPVDTMSEASRVVRPGGHIAVILAVADDHPDDRIAAILSGLAGIRRPGRGLDPILDAAPPNSSLVHTGYTDWAEFSATPNGAADLVERRGYSTLFDIDDDTWDRVVVPVIEQLRAMPDPDAPIPRRNRHPILVWQVSSDQ